MNSDSIDHIKLNRIRPRIRFETEYSPEQLHRRIKEYLSKPEIQCEGQILPGFATFYPKESDQHYWSPQLTINFEKSETGSLVRGLYGPKPSVWTMFIFFYSFIGFITMIAAMVSLSYWSLGEASIIFWSVPVLILIFLSLFLVAYLGQKFGHKQIVNIHRFLEDCVGKRIETI
ncbi:MAG: hypothetical protein JJ971_13225 [Balneolaceae bacterium]|nr:hypothetical protein [Balneolaceae bacterium]MBO6547184.1 hypothetical protein [Balneolaceae bacterium]MBO6647869.1 hypothetical protein [Balneolaceae bacterium]